jgi:hypothetical protein
MNPRSEWVLKAFLSRRPSEERRSLERFLPEDERLLLAQIPELQSGDEFSHSLVLDDVHWSWFLPTLKSYSEKEQAVFLEALSPAVAENLRRALQIETVADPITDMAKSFLRSQLLHSLIGPNEGRLPPSFLPASPLNVLLTLSKKDLIRLIDLLPLPDLAAEMRQIVETKILKKLYSFLSEEQKAAMKHLSSQREPLSSSRMGLERWDGAEESLRALLHRRGLARLGLALSGQDPDLVWTLCHRLDIGRGNALFKLCAPEPVANATEAAQRQIEELLPKL